MEVSATRSPSLTVHWGGVAGRQGGGQQRKRGVRGRVTCASCRWPPSCLPKPPPKLLWGTNGEGLRASAAGAMTGAGPRLGVVRRSGGCMAHAAWVPAAWCRMRRMRRRRADGRTWLSARSAGVGIQVHRQGRAALRKGAGAASGADRRFGPAFAGGARPPPLARAARPWGRPVTAGSDARTTAGPLRRRQRACRVAGRAGRPRALRDCIRLGSGLQ
jgi:hypothetical protein